MKHLLHPQMSLFFQEMGLKLNLSTEEPEKNDFDNFSFIKSHRGSTVGVKKTKEWVIILQLIYF
jgi:hypothetical protein